MKAFTLLLLLLSFSSAAQSKFQYQRTTFNKDISFIQLDSATGVRSTIVEYPKFLVVIELPMHHDGANRGAGKLPHHRFTATAILAATAHGFISYLQV
jgi:hypothetical protein